MRFAIIGCNDDSLRIVRAIADPGARSAAMFTELGKVLTNPRCVNCHPVGDRPLQGEVSNRRLKMWPPSGVSCLARYADTYWAP